MSASWNRNRHTVLGLYGALIVLPSLVFGALYWRSLTEDYEAELALVIGKRCSRVKSADALDVIAGYSCFNDGSVREYQRKTSQWTPGKNFDGTGPFGPVVVTPDELPAGASGLRITTRVNGQVRQQWPVGDMLYKLDELISVLSQGMTLEPGEMLICGTVPGVGFEQLPQIWLQHLDVVETEISKIGVLRNVVKMRQAEQVAQ